MSDDKKQPTELDETELDGAEGGLKLTSAQEVTLSVSNTLTGVGLSDAGETPPLSVGYTLDEVSDAGATPPLSVDTTIKTRR